MPEQTKRVKDISEHNKAILSGVGEDLRNFYMELQSNYDTELYLTSGKRADKGSRHGTGEALDFRSRGYEHLYSDLMNTDWGLGLMNKYGVGILDETDPEILAKTKGTAPHFHIGKDSTLVPQVRQRYQDFQAGKQIDEKIAFAAKPYVKQGSTIQSSQGTQLPTVNIPTIDANEAIRSYRSYQAIEAGLMEEKETQDKTVEKQQNAAIKQLQEKQEQRNKFIAEISKLNPIVEQNRPQRQQDMPTMQEQSIDIQQQMPQLFKIQ